MYGTLSIRIIHGRDLWADENGTSDPYCKLKIQDYYKLKTNYIDTNLNPIWNESFEKPIKFVLEDY